MKRLTLAAGFAALTLSAPAVALDINAMTDAEREIFRTEIRAYLMDNPEVLMEAIGVLEERQAAAQVGNDAALLHANAEDIYNDGASYVGGNPEGDVTIVEFTDYRCPYCRRAHPEVADLVAADGNIRHIIKEFPILGPDSLSASQFATAVLLLNGPEAYAQANDAMMNLRGDPSEAALKGVATKLSLDADAVIEKMKSDEVAAVIQNNRSLGQRLQISGTPTFVVGDQLVRGYIPQESMGALVEEIRSN